MNNLIITQEMLITVLEIDKYLEISDNKPIEFHVGKNNQNLYRHRNTQTSIQSTSKLGEKRIEEYDRKLGSPLRVSIKKNLISQPSESRTPFSCRK